MYIFYNKKNEIAMGFVIYHFDTNRFLYKVYIILIDKIATSCIIVGVILYLGNK